MKLSSDELVELQKTYSYLVNYQGNDPNAPIDPMTYRDSDGDSLLHIAVRKGDARSVELLIKAGMDTNIVGDMGYTPLHCANEKHDEKIAKLLIVHGASESIRNEFGKTPKDYKQ